MLYYLIEYLDSKYSFSGGGLIHYITFRSAIAFLTALLISTLIGKRIIKYLRKRQIGETVRDLGLEGQNQKVGTPTMGGIIFIIAALVPVLLFTKLENIYIIILIITTLWMGAIGFIDDYTKIFKKDKKGLKGKFKVLGQVGLGLIVGFILYFSPDVKIKEKKLEDDIEMVKDLSSDGFGVAIKSTKTTIPFLKNNEFDYAFLISWIGDNYQKYSWLIFIPVVIFIITSVSNGANLTDGIDGLAGGISVIIVVTLGILAWISGNIVFSDYLNVMYIPESGEMTIFISALAGGLTGFLWYNTYPAQVFMGDTGSLTIGAVIAVIAIAVRKELLIPLLAGVFLIENLSVILQVSYFRYTKKRIGQGKRIFLMSPLHHHYQKLGYHESKIVSRFWIIGIILAVLTIITLKIR